MQKQTKQFLQEVEADGWSWELRRSGHLKLTGPSGEIAFAAATPSDRRALQNIRSDMRRATRQVKESA